MIRYGWSFRPLSRQIGSYTADEIVETPVAELFPSPLEADRFLYPIFCGWI